MKKYFLYLSLLLNLMLSGIVFYNWYLDRNKLEYFDFVKSVYQTLRYEPDSFRVCLVGNSITANWINLNPDFFKTQNIVNRGIGGNTSSQMLLRFEQDVISTKPTVVVINAGINDLANGDGFYSQVFTLNNIQAMIDICKANKITPVLSSVLPAKELRVNRFKKYTDVRFTIVQLNKDIEKLAIKNDLIYIDYHTSMKDEHENLNIKYTFDGLHPNVEGYLVMEKVLKETLTLLSNSK